MRQSERRLRRIVDAGVPFANRAEELFQRLLDRSPKSEKSILCEGHGDYSRNQILLSERRTVTCDWDGYDSADPCRDAARFIVCLGRLALTELGSIRKLDSTSETFRKASLAGDGRRMADQAFYKAALHLQEAKRDVVSQAPRRLERAEILLDEGLRELAGYEDGN
jgi:aminoglycoside phosphotransferase (APT) family kinase protein